MAKANQQVDDMVVVSVDLANGQTGLFGLAIQSEDEDEIQTMVAEFMSQDNLGVWHFQFVVNAQIMQCPYCDTVATFGPQCPKCKKPILSQDGRPAVPNLKVFQGLQPQRRSTALESMNRYHLNSKNVMGWDALRADSMLAEQWKAEVKSADALEERRKAERAGICLANKQTMDAAVAQHDMAKKIVRGRKP